MLNQGTPALAHAREERTATVAVVEASRSVPMESDRESIGYHAVCEGVVDMVVSIYRLAAFNGDVQVGVPAVCKPLSFFVHREST